MYGCEEQTEFLLQYYGQHTHTNNLLQSVGLQQTTRRNIPEDTALRNHRFQNFQNRSKLIDPKRPQENLQWLI
jgi:hypothetical protein